MGAGTIILMILIPLILVVLVVMSALFSFSEMAISSTNKARIKTIKDDKNTSKRKKKQAEKVIVFVENYNQHISAIVIFNNIVNVLFSTLATLFFTQLVTNETFGFTTNDFYGALLSFIVTTPIVIIFGEIVPKQLAKKYPETGTMRLSSMLVIVNYLMYPITALLKKMIKEEEQAMLGSDQEIELAIKEATKQGVTTSFEEQLIRKSLDIDNMLLSEVMIPLESAVVIKGKLTEAKLKNTIKKNPHTRFPIVDGKGNVKAIFSAKRFLVDTLKGKVDSFNDYQFDFAKFNLDDNPYHVFEMLRNRRERMAVVVDENDRFVGIVTIEDIIELMLGNIYDEDDLEEDGVYTLSDTSFIVSPKVKIGYLKENYIKTIKTDEEYDKLTIERFVQVLSGKKPKAGQHYTFKNIIIWATEDKVDDTKINFEVDII